MLAALRVGEFTLARRTASSFLSTNDTDAEALTLSGDALWAAGFFDEADREYARALAVDSSSARARYGIARSLSSRSRLTEALSEVDHALELSPSDPDLPALRGTVLERINRFEEAARAYEGYANLLPRRESAAITIARSRASLLRSFSKRPPLEVSAEDESRTSQPAVQAGEQQDRRPRPVERDSGRVGARYRRRANRRVARRRERRRNPRCERDTHGRRRPCRSSAEFDWGARTRSRSDR